MHILWSWILSALTLMATAYVVRGFKVRSFVAALLAAILIGLANAFLRPIFVFLTFPLTIVTFGLFLFVVNAAVLRVCAWFLPGFDIEGWGPAILGAFVLALINTGLNYLI